MLETKRWRPTAFSQEARPIRTVFAAPQGAGLFRDLSRKYDDVVAQVMTAARARSALQHAALMRSVAWTTEGSPVANHVLVESFPASNAITPRAADIP